MLPARSWPWGTWTWVIVHHFHAHVRDTAGHGKSRRPLYLILFQTEAHSYHELIPQITAALITSNNRAAIFRDLCAEWAARPNSRAHEHNLATLQNEVNTSA